jgi:hypothetical protein
MKLIGLRLASQSSSSAARLHIPGPAAVEFVSFRRLLRDKARLRL